MEDYRSKKKVITGPDDEFSVPPGDYRVRCYCMDVEIPRRQLAEHLGEEDFAYWNELERRSNRSCNITVMVVLLSLIVGGFVSWWLAGAIVLALFGMWFVLDTLRGRDPRYGEVSERVWKYAGEETFEELEEEWQEGKLCLAIELRRLGDEPRPSGGFVSEGPTSESED